MNKLYPLQEKQTDTGEHQIVAESKCWKKKYLDENLSMFKGLVRHGKIIGGEEM